MTGRGTVSSARTNCCAVSSSQSGLWGRDRHIYGPGGFHHVEFSVSSWVLISRLWIVIIVSI